MQHFDDYLSSKRHKLDDPPTDPESLRVHIANAELPGDHEVAALQQACRRHNFALFRFEGVSGDPTPALLALGDRLGLSRLDHNLCADASGITAISVRDDAAGNRYIPYTNRPLSWHTDGYYNPGSRQIHAWLLYCARSAAEGGENAVLDPDIALLRLYDHDPALVTALAADDALTIPANEQDGSELRAAQSGPVFSLSPASGQLHMRYSARQRNVVWQDRAAVRRGAEFLLDLFSAGDEHIFRYRLQPGEGLISNNALHCRSGFRDDPASGRTRLVYRARYYDRVAGT